MSTRSHLDNRPTIELGRPPFTVAPPARCGHRYPQGQGGVFGRRCGNFAYWLVPEHPYCKDHMPEHLIVLAERRRTAWEWRARTIWADILRSIQ